MRTNVPGGIEIIGVDGSGAVVVRARLAHGQHPERLLLEQGWRAVRPVAASGDELGVRVEFAVTRAEDVTVGPMPLPPREDGVGPHEAVVPYQRLGVYAVVVEAGAVLLTQFNDRTGIPGRWGLPGGGLDEGEDPVAGVHREVWEETGQAVVLGELLEVQSSHWVGRSPSHGAEDFHAVRIVWAARCPQPVPIVVHDEGGTTAAAEWVALARLSEVDMTASWRGLAELVSRATQD